jgi:hypothetical protein
MKAVALLLAAAPILAQTDPSTSSSLSSFSLRGAASSSSSAKPPTDARSLQLNPQESCYFYGTPFAPPTNITCTADRLSKCDQLMSSDCADTQQQAIDDAEAPCTYFAVWYENSDSCAWAFVCCDNP